MTERLEPFDIPDPLPTGTTLLEASAGTGKTWTIGALVTRYVAEGDGAARADAGRHVRPRGQPGAARARPRPSWSRPSARWPATRPCPTYEPSDLIALLLDCDDDEIVRAGTGACATRWPASTRATIATTHQFCSMVLDSLGVAGDTDSRARLVEDLDDLLVEVVDDLYLRAFAYADDDPVFTYAEALAIARTAVNDPQARLEPTAEEPGTAGRPPGRVRRGGPRPRSSGASDGSGSCRTTTCSASSPTRWSSPTRRPARGCGSAGRSCWSTSSRTPTRCSGTCSTGRSPATPRWC